MTKKLKLDALRNALSSLQDSLNVVGDRQWFGEQSGKVQNTLLAGVIQNFEFVYEISVKMIKRQIEADALIPEPVDHQNFRDVLRIAAETGLIADVQAWFGYRDMRNNTAHTYDQEKAKLVYAATHDFMIDARTLLHTLEARNA